MLFLVLFPLSTVASDSSFQSHKTGGGTVVAVTEGLAFLVRISAPHVRCLQMAFTARVCLKAGGRHTLESAVKIEGVIYHDLRSCLVSA